MERSGAGRERAGPPDPEGSPTTPKGRPLAAVWGQPHRRGPAGRPAGMTWPPCREDVAALPAGLHLVLGQRLPEPTKAWHVLPW
jgi:hypothetical protein